MVKEPNGIPTQRRKGLRWNKPTITKKLEDYVLGLINNPDFVEISYRNILMGCFGEYKYMTNLSLLVKKLRRSNTIGYYKRIQSVITATNHPLFLKLSTLKENERYCWVCGLIKTRDCFYEKEPDCIECVRKRPIKDPVKRARQIYKRTEEYKEKKRENVRKVWHNRRAREKETSGTYDPKDWLYLLEITENKCLKCGLGGEPMTRDHIVVLGWGSNCITNLQPYCRSCNPRKGARHFEDSRPEHIKELIYRRAFPNLIGMMEQESGDNVRLFLLPIYSYEYLV